MSEQDAKRTQTPTAERQQRWRKRQARGQAVFRVTLNVDRVALALQRAGLLTTTEAMDHSSLSPFASQDYEDCMSAAVKDTQNTRGPSIYWDNLAKNDFPKAQARWRISILSQ